MDFEKFKESLIEDVQQGLYEKGIEANVSTNKVSKLNESYEALTVTPEGCKLRSNGMPVPLLRNGYSIFNGTKCR